MQGAIAQARTWPGGSVALELPKSAPPDLSALNGKAGVICVTLVDYSGFEPVQRLVAAAVVDGAPIDPSIAARLIRLSASESQTLHSEVDPQLIDDAVDEAVFVDQREVEKGEQRHFEKAIGQLERFVEDKILICRRERTGITEKLTSAYERRNEVVGSSARERVESEIGRLSTRDEELQQRIAHLESREDEVYKKWRNEYHELRYRTPAVTRLFQATFQIAPGPMAEAPITADPRATSRPAPKARMK